VTFIYGNVNHARYYFQDILSLIHLYQQEYPNPSPLIQQFATEIELEFVLEDLQKLLNSIKLGAERIRDIILSLRNFSHLGQSAKKSTDIQSGIEQTLRILEHRLRVDESRSGIEVIKEYGQLPKVTCCPGQINQVFFHILSNAIDALEELRTHGDVNKKPQIRICTQVTKSNSVLICLADNGCGINDDILPRIFDPFFTTKPVGRGTGLGLSVSYSIVVHSHKGQLSCVSQSGQGTEFVIELPI
jgi:signal transduction histidine kinase